MKTIKILGQKISILDERIAYNQYRLLFQAEADRAVNRFKEIYSQNGNLDEVIKNVPDQICQSIQPSIQLCIDTLIQHHVMIVDAARFEEMYPHSTEIWTEAYLHLYDQYAEIVMDQKALDKYRVARRQGRARWSGGGFGLSGAIKGAATAGVLNIVTGAGHMLFNGVGKLISSVATSAQKNKIYRSSETYESLSKGVWNAVFFLHYGLIDCLSKTGADCDPLNGSVSDADAQDAVAVLHNAESISDPDLCRSALIDAFQKNPYQSDWYLYVLNRFGDDGSLNSLAKYFGVSALEEEKLRLLESYAESLPLSNEEEAQAAISKIQEYQKKLHCTKKTPHIKAAYDAVKRFDAAFRTVDGILLPTREAADLARKELSEISKIEQEIDYDSLSSIQAAEKRMEKYQSPVAMEHQKTLHQKWKDLDKNLRTIDPQLPNQDPLVCETRQEAEQLQSQIQTLDHELDACGTTDEKALLTFRSKLSDKNFSPVLVRCYQAEVDRRLTAIDLALRTTLDKEYPSREAARAAEEEYESIQPTFSQESPRKNPVEIRKRIENADFSESIRRQLLDQLFQYENAVELKTAKVFTAISTIIIFAIVIGSYFFQLSGTEEFSRKDVIVKGVSLMITDVQVDNDLTFLDGLKNGIVVFGRSVGEIFVDGFFDYIGGFDYGLLGNILRGFLGLIWVILKEFILFIPRYIVSLIVTLIQQASISYYIGYVIGAAIPIAVSQLNFDEDTPEENVKRIKGWTAKKVLLCIVAIVLVALISVHFILNEL